MLGSLCSADILCKGGQGLFDEFDECVEASHW